MRVLPLQHKPEAVFVVLQRGSTHLSLPFVGHRVEALVKGIWVEPIWQDHWAMLTKEAQEGS